MKTNFIANNTVINSIMKKYMKYICAVLMIIGTSVHAWGTAPGANYTLVTSASNLSAGDAVILYDDVNNVGVTGTSGTSATFSSNSDDWIEYTVAKPNGSTVTLADWSLLSAPKIYADEDGNMYKFTYSTSSNTSFTINSSGHLVCSTTRLAHYGEYVRFYASSGTALKVYKVGSPKVYGEECDGNLCVNPDVINMAGEYNGLEDALLESDKFTVTTTYSGKNHHVYVEYDDDELLFGVYDYEYDEPLGSNGYYTAGTGEDISTLKIVCYASAAGTYSATLHVYAYNYDGAGNYKHVAVPVTITVLEEEQECTARTLSFANGTSDKTIYKADATTYTNAATPSTGAGYGTVTYSVTSASPSGCATVNGSGVVSFSNYGSVTITASLGANGDYCAAADVSYTVSMECKSRTLSFASSTPSVSISTETYTQTATKSAGSGTISYAMVQSVGSGFTIDPETGEVSFNGNAGTATITASITADATGGYCTAEGSYTLTVTPVVPTVSAFSYTSGETSMTLNGSAVTDNGGTAISAYGYIYSTTASAVGTLVLGGEGVTTAQVAAANIAVGTTFAEKSITSLSEGATYYVRAYATNSAGTGYSDIQTVKTVTYSNFQFSCSELTLTAHPETAGAPIFITSAANKKVRSQDYITITGSGLTPNTPLTFPGLDSKFEVLTATGGTISTDPNGEINVNAYIFYTPAVDATTDGLDQMAGLTVSVGGAKPKQASLVQSIIGRHLPTAGYVIAGKKDNKWYALPSNMASTGTPAPSEIAVDNINNPSIAYTAATNIYGLEGPVASNISGGNGQYVRLTMSIESSEGSGKPAPLFGTSGSEDASNSPKVGKSGTAIATNPLSEGWWWSLTQTNTSITNPQDAKYTVKCANNNHTLSIKNSPFVWGLYASGVEELRLIPASDIVFTEAYFVEWAQHGGVIEVDAEGVDATSVVAHLGEATSSAITLSQTLTSGKSRASKYNYTVNFGDGIDFAAAASNGAMLTLEWKNGATTKAVSNIVVPKIVASDITINKANYPLKSDWNTEVHVLPGKTVTVDADYSPNPDVTIKELNIYPGATVVASTGTLIATTLVLRNGWSRAGSKTYDVARLHVTASAATLKATNVYADWYIDYDQYYPIAVPWNATVANFTYRYCTVAPTVGPSGNIRMRYYDGASRATNVQEGVGSGANWKQYGEGGNLPVPTTLTPSTGYAMTAKRPTGKAFSIIRMPLTLPSGTWGEGSWTTNGESGEVSGTHKDQVAVTAWGTGSTPEYAKGWNLIANPYMSLHQGAITYTEGETNVAYVNIPDVDFKEYDQKPTALTKLAPASAFLIKAPETGTITFGTANRKPSAPSYRTEEKPESIPEQQAYIVLSNEQSEDMMGILVSEKYTSEYETNADLEKLLSDGNTLRTYMRYGDMNMAYVAINEMLAKEWIPVSVRIPADGEYTFSLHEASIAGELEGVYLIDYQNGDKVTNLIEQSYTFSSTAGTINGRFSINAKTGERQTPTGIDAINAGGDINSDKPFKFIYHDKVYIWINGIIYDTTGKRVK